MAGGRNPKLRGTRFEREVRKDLEARGYVVVRSGASLSPMDLVAIGCGAKGNVLLVQCKKNGVLPPAEWNELRDLALGSATVPVLAERIDTRKHRGENPILYWFLSGRKDGRTRYQPRERMWPSTG